MNTGQKMKAIRLALGYSTQAKFGKLLKVDRTMITKIENNAEKLPRDMANKLIDICKALNFRIGTKNKTQDITLDYLYREDDDDH